MAGCRRGARTCTEPGATTGSTGVAGRRRACRRSKTHRDRILDRVRLSLTGK
jgi:hypothetical protein